jgi:ferredoxin-NADP reductase
MRKSIHSVTTKILSINEENNIKIFTLVDPDSWDLPRFSAGAHLDIYLTSGKVRQYSLCGDPENCGEYVIAVQKEEGGRGGSIEMHDLKVGMILQVSLPRNYFPLVEATRHILVAGGIGITPFLSMVPTLIKQAVDWELHVFAKSASRVACKNLLKAYEKDPRVHMHLSEGGNRLSVSNIISSIGNSDHIYACGPNSMIAEMVDFGKELGDRLHFENFGVDRNITNPAYKVILKKSGSVVKVREGQTMLQALRIAGIEVPSSCEGGICLECKTRYLEGTPLHLDLVMQSSDRGEYITPCVSSCTSEEMILDL